VNRTEFVGTQSHRGSLVVPGLNSGMVQGGVGEERQQEGSNRPRFPQVRAQIFRFQAENCVDISEATV
jgi:hypothetical protein